MNAERLYDLVRWLLVDERNHKIQDQLNSLAAVVSNVVSAPQEPTYQLAFVEGLEKLRSSLEAIVNDYDPATWSDYETIGVKKYFTTEIVEMISAAAQHNSMTPAVVQQQITELIAERENRLEVLRNARSSLKLFGFDLSDLDEGEAEIGFKIPRELFKNELEGLIQELRGIRRIIRAFSEKTTKSAEPIELHQISTSDPLFFFGLSTGTILAIGGAVTWALNTWKQVEDIRKVRAETGKLKGINIDEVQALFDKTIASTIEAQIEKKTIDLLGPPPATASRVAEQHTDMKWALESLFA